MLRHNNSSILFLLLRFKQLIISMATSSKFIFVCLFVVKGIEIKSKTFIKPLDYEFSIPDYRQSFYAYPYTRYYQKYCRDNKVRMIERVSNNTDSILQISFYYFNKFGRIQRDSTFSVNSRRDTFITSIVFTYSKHKRNGITVTEEKRSYYSKDKNNKFSITKTITHYNNDYMPDSVVKTSKEFFKNDSTDGLFSVYYFTYNSKNELIYSIVKENNQIDTLELRKYDFSSESLHAELGLSDSFEYIKNYVRLVDEKASIKASFFTINLEKRVSIIDKTYLRTFANEEIGFIVHIFLSYKKIGVTYSQNYQYCSYDYSSKKQECSFEIGKTFANNKLLMQYNGKPISYKMHYYE